MSPISEPEAWRSPLGKLVRFAGVSLLGTLITQILLFVLVDGFGWAGVPANVVAVVVSTVPAYFLNRAWVWGHEGQHSLHRQVLPYWGLSLAGLLISTFFAWLAYRAVHRGWAVSLANLGGFGLLWVVKYRVLDRYLFHPNASSSPQRRSADAPSANATTTTTTTTNQMEHP